MLILVVTPIIVNVVTVVIFDNIMRRRVRNRQASVCGEVGSGPFDHTGMGHSSDGSLASLRDPLVADDVHGDERHNIVTERNTQSAGSR